MENQVVGPKEWPAYGFYFFTRWQWLTQKGFKHTEHCPTIHPFSDHFLFNNQHNLLHGWACGSSFFLDLVLEGLFSILAADSRWPTLNLPLNPKCSIPHCHHLDADWRFSDSFQPSLQNAAKCRIVSVFSFLGTIPHGALHFLFYHTCLQPWVCVKLSLHTVEYFTNTVLVLKLTELQLLFDQTRQVSIHSLQISEP